MKETAHRPGGTPRLLTSIARCAACGGPLSASGSTIRGVRRSYYICGRSREGKSRCGVHVQAPRLESAVLDAVHASVVRLDREALVRELRRIVPKVEGEDLAALEDRLRRLDARIALLVGDLDASDDAVSKGLAKLREERTRIMERIARARATGPALDVDALVRGAVEAATRLDAPDTDEGRAALRATLRVFVARLAVGAAPRGKPKPVELTVYEPTALAFTSTGVEMEKAVRPAGRTASPSHWIGVAG